MARVDREEVLGKLYEEAKLPPSFFWNFAEDDEAVRIISFVAGFFSIPVEDLISQSRKREILRPRQWSIFFIRELTDLSLSEIGSYFTNKDHSTVLHSCKTIKNFMSIYPADRKIYKIIKNHLE